ncbi:Cartilage acidic protein 1 [Bienertia sinuspersici]
MLHFSSSESFGYAQDPGQTAAKALSCFNANNVYTRCNEAYRLTQSGYLNVPPAATDQFCYGPCLAETHLVLDCVDHSLSNFVFYNKATINDIRATLKAACGHEHERGNFNVDGYMQDYLQGEWSSADLPPLPKNMFTLISVSFVLIFMIRRAV